MLTFVTIDSMVSTSKTQAEESVMQPNKSAKTVEEKGSWDCKHKLCTQPDDDNMFQCKQMHRPSTVSDCSISITWAPKLSMQLLCQYTRIPERI